jgi:hypothetical protein
LALNSRFGSEGLELMVKIEKIRDEEQLQTIQTVLANAADLEEIRKLLPSSAP